MIATLKNNAAKLELDKKHPLDIFIILFIEDNEILIIIKRRSSLISSSFFIVFLVGITNFNSIGRESHVG